MFPFRLLFAVSSCLKPKIMIGAMLRGPGPAQYALPGCIGTTGVDVRIQAPPSYTMRPMVHAIVTVRSPGPGRYGIPSGQYRDGTSSGQSYTMRMKPNEISGKGQQPGPGKYGSPDPTKTNERAAPAYTMRPQLPGHVAYNTPGPNNYKLPTLMGGPVVNSKSGGFFKSSSQWSMTGRSDIGSFAEVRSRAPGPGKYAPENCTQKVKRAQPSYTMRKRTYQPLAGSKTPGPKYDVRGKMAPRGGTFGVRHSAYVYAVCE
jgi:hypothetical protein